jgi:hypothetical protein
MLGCLLTAVVAQAESTDLLPAGMLLTCTIDEPNFSTKTAQIGDPILCHLGTTTAFGHQVFPHGSYLSGRLADARDPGHFYGKGWLWVQFDRLVLPGEAILSLDAKMVSAPHYKIDREGKIDGKGHAKRDAVEWMLPPLWPLKVLTLPARGPYPALKGETRVTLRLMDDIVLPTQTTSAHAVPMPQWAKPTSQSGLPAGYSAPATMKLAAVRTPPARPVEPQLTGRETVLVMKNDFALVVEKYWIYGNTIQCQLTTGEPRMFDISKLDFARTVALNSERNVGFVLATQPQPDQSAIQ